MVHYLRISMKAGAMAQWLRLLAALPEVLDLVPHFPQKGRMRGWTYNHLLLQFQGSDASAPGIHECWAHIQEKVNTHKIKQK